MTNSYIDIVPYITSDDYKERMIGEYKEINIRRKKLLSILNLADINMLDFELTCPIYLLRRQYDIMKEYEDILYARMQIEGIEI